MSAVRSRVAVLRVGAVSALGAGDDALWEGLLAGRRGLGATPPSARGIPLPSLCGSAALAAAAVESRIDARVLRRLSMSSRLAMGAATMCLGGLPDAAREETAVILGTCFGASTYHFDYYEKLFRGGLRDASPLLFSESVMNAAAGHISIHWKLRGPSLAVLGGEDAGLGAIVDARDKILLGEAVAALAGGVEEHCDFVHAATASRGLVKDEAGAPYEGNERGTFFAEGAALLLVAAARTVAGSSPLAWIVGAGAARGDATREGGAIAVERAVREALEEAGVESRAVSLAVTSASGSPLDAAEAEGLARALEAGRGPRDAPLAIAAPKAALGEGFAFTSAAQALVGARALAERTVPPTPGHLQPVLLPSWMRLPRRAAELTGSHAVVVSLNRCGAATCIVLEAATR